MTTDTYTHAAITANYYGYGDSDETALAACRNAGGTKALKRAGYVVFRFKQPLHFEIQWDGGLRWQTADGSDAPKDYEVDESNLKETG